MDIAPLLPSLGVYEEYLHSDVQVCHEQTVRQFKSSKPLEGTEEINPTHFEGDDVEESDVVDVHGEMDIEDDSSNILIAKRRHELAPRYPEVAVKKKKVVHSTTVDTENTSLWQVESVIEVPFVNLNVEMPEIHSFQRHQGYDLLIGDCQDKNLKKEDETVEELKTVDVKQERVSSDSDDITITFVEEGFPKKVKKEVGTSSAAQPSMKIVSTDNTDQEFQRIVKILAEVHQPQATVHVPSLLDHDYIPQNVVEVKLQPSTSSGKMRQEEMVCLKDEDPNPELDVFIPPAVGGITKSTMSMVYRPRYRMPEKEMVTIAQTPSSTTQVGAPVPAEHQLEDHYYCNKCSKSFKDVNYFR